MQKLNLRLTLPFLWIFVTLNYLYCDLFGLMDPPILNQFISGEVNGLTMNEDFLLIASFLMQIPMAMVLVSRFGRGKVNKWANVVAGSIMTIVQVLTLFIGATTSYYLFYSIVEISTTMAVIVLALRAGSEAFGVSANDQTHS